MQRSINISKGEEEERRVRGFEPRQQRVQIVINTQRHKLEPNVAVDNSEKLEKKKMRCKKIKSSAPPSSSSQLH